MSSLNQIKIDSLLLYRCFEASSIWGGEGLVYNAYLGSISHFEFIIIILLNGASDCSNPQKQSRPYDMRFA